MESVTKTPEAPKTIDVNQFINSQFNSYFNLLGKDIVEMAKRTKNGSIKKGYQNVLNLINYHKNFVNQDYLKLKAKNEEKKAEKQAE